MVTTIINSHFRGYNISIKNSTSFTSINSVAKLVPGTDFTFSRAVYTVGNGVKKRLMSCSKAESGKRYVEIIIIYTDD